MRRIARAWLLLIITISFSSAAPEPRVLELRASFSWAGYSPSWFGYDYVFTCDSNGACRATGSNWKRISGSARKTSCRFAASPIKADALQALWQASLQNLMAVDEPLEVIAHTDDYPEFNLKLTTQSGVTVLVNTSNGKPFPWNVRRSGRWYAQSTGQLERAYVNLIRLLPCRPR